MSLLTRLPLANSRQRAYAMADRGIRELLIGWTAILIFALTNVYFSQCKFSFLRSRKRLGCRNARAPYSLIRRTWVGNRPVEPQGLPGDYLDQRRVGLAQTRREARANRQGFLAATTMLTKSIYIEHVLCLEFRGLCGVGPWIFYWYWVVWSSS
jgi:hypothetical protein